MKKKYLKSIFTSVGLGRVWHSQTPQTQVPLSLQRMSVVLSERQAASWSPKTAVLESHSQNRPEWESSQWQMPHFKSPPPLHWSALLMYPCQIKTLNRIEILERRTNGINLPGCLVVRSHSHTTSGDRPSVTRWYRLDRFGKVVAIPWGQLGSQTTNTRLYKMSCILKIEVGSRKYLNSSGEVNYSANFESVAPVCLYHGSVSQARWVISYFNSTSSVIFHLNWRRNFLFKKKYINKELLNWFVS